MRFTVLTLFPEMVEQGFRTSITGRAMEKGLLSLRCINFRAYSDGGNGYVDDYPYGGGAGMVMQAGPICRAYEDIQGRIAGTPRVIYVTPQGKVFDEKMAEEMSAEEDIVILCGHYEGVDERALTRIVTDYVSIGDYVLTGGELPAMVMIDAIARLVPGVLNNGESAEFESFHDGLLEYPQYTRPEDFMGDVVPGVLLSGHHAKIEEWRRQQSLKRTKERRPDLLKNARLTASDRKYLESLEQPEEIPDQP